MRYSALGVCFLFFTFFGCAEKVQIFRLCEENETQVCSCGTGYSDGIQACNNNGSSWEKCDCSQSIPVVDTEKDTGQTGDTASDVDTAAGGDGDADTDADADTAVTLSTDSDPAVCESQGLDIIPKPGRMMLLLDMSSSMLDGDPPKLDQATAALSGMLLQFEGRGIEFGLDLFPDGSLDPAGTLRCGVNNDVLIDCAMNNEQVVITELEQSHITGATPLYCAMQNFTDPTYAPIYRSVDGNNILVVVTDGMDNCFTDCQENTQLAANGAFGTLAASLCADHGIKTVAVGFGSDVNPGQLNAVAKSGCTEFTEYLQVADQDELQNALELLAGLALRCTFAIGTIDNERVDPTLVNVYFDNTIVPYDEGCATGAGWTWTGSLHNEIEFCKDACALLHSGDVTSVTAKFGCKTVSIV